MTHLSKYILMNGTSVPLVVAFCLEVGFVMKEACTIGNPTKTPEPQPKNLGLAFNPSI